MEKSQPTASGNCLRVREESRGCLRLIAPGHFVQGGSSHGHRVNQRPEFFLRGLQKGMDKERMTDGTEEMLSGAKKAGSSSASRLPLLPTSITSTGLKLLLGDTQY